MKLRKAIKLAAAGALVSASSVAMAVPAITTFSTDANDNITAATPAGMTCTGTPIQEAGFMQRQCTDGSDTYIQSILVEGETADGGATFTGNLGFADQNFVKMGGTGGIIAQSHLADRTTNGSVTEDFNSTGTINAGEFRVNDQVGIQMDQSISETDSVDTDAAMGATFRLIETTETAQGTNVTAKLQMSGLAQDADFTGKFAMETYVVEDSGTYSGSANYKKIDVDASLIGEVTQTVALRERTGASIVDANSMDSGAGSNGSWLAGETVVNLVIEQSVLDAGEFGLNDFANESTGGEHGIDSFIDSNASTFQAASTNGSDPFAAINTTGW